MNRHVFVVHQNPGSCNPSRDKRWWQDKIVKSVSVAWIMTWSTVQRFGDSSPDEQKFSYLLLRGFYKKVHQPLHWHHSWELWSDHHLPSFHLKCMLCYEEEFRVLWHSISNVVKEVALLFGFFMRSFQFEISKLSDGWNFFPLYQTVLFAVFHHLLVSTVHQNHICLQQD